MLCILIGLHWGFFKGIEKKETMNAHGDCMLEKSCWQIIRVTYMTLLQKKPYPTYKNQAMTVLQNCNYSYLKRLK